MGKRKLSAVTLVPLRDLRQVPEKWNLRDFAADGHREFLEREAARDLVDELCGTVERGGRLDPIIVFEADGVFEIVDGHYRFKAYSRTLPASVEVPVRIFLGSAEEARIYAFQENSKVRSVMSTAQRTEAAWQLFATNPSLQAMSKRKLATFLNVSPSSVFNMKRALEAYSNIEYLKRSAYKVKPWREVLREIRDEEDQEDIREDVQLVQQIAGELVELLGRQVKTNPREVRQAWEMVGKKYGLPHYEHGPDAGELDGVEEDLELDCEDI